MVRLQQLFHWLSSCFIVVRWGLAAVSLWYCSKVGLSSCFIVVGWGLAAVSLWYCSKVGLSSCFIVVFFTKNSYFAITVHKTLSACRLFVFDLCMGDKYESDLTVTA